MAMSLKLLLPKEATPDGNAFAKQVCLDSARYRGLFGKALMKRSDMIPFLSTENSESRFHFQGVIATVVGGFTRNFLRISFPQATPKNRKKVHQCNKSNYGET